MINNKISHLLYGRVETPLASGRFPSPGFQMIGCSPSIESIAVELSETITFSTSLVSRFWESQGSERTPEMWSYRPIEQGNQFLIVKTMFFQDRELLDRNNRVAPISHAILIPRPVFHELKFQPFSLIDSPNSFFVETPEDILTLKQLEFEETIFEADDGCVLPPEEDDQEPWSINDLKKMFVVNAELRRKNPDARINISGKAERILDFFRMLHLKMAPDSRSKFSFTMNPDFRDSKDFSIAPGVKGNGEICVDADKRIVDFPNSPENEGFFFWNRWKSGVQELSLPSLVEQIPTVDALITREETGAADFENDESIDESVLDLYWESNREKIATSLFDSLCRRFSRDFVNSFIDYWLPSVTESRERIRILQDDDLDDGLLATKILDWIYHLQQQSEILVNKRDWRTLAKISAEEESWKLLLAVGLIGTGNRRHISLALANLPASEFEEVFTQLVFIPPNRFLEPKFVFSIANCFQTEFYTDKEVYDVMYWLARNGTQELPPWMKSRLKRLPERSRVKIERLLS